MEVKRRFDELAWLFTASASIQYGVKQLQQYTMPNLRPENLGFSDYFNMFFYGMYIVLGVYSLISLLIKQILRS